jgi:hypothetical protein
LSADDPRENLCPCTAEADLAGVLPDDQTLAIVHNHDAESLVFIRGIHPLEVIRGAAFHAAQALFEPKGKPIELGMVRPDLLADLVIVEENPIANLKTLYGTGVRRLNDETGKVAVVGGVKYTIKDGIIYDAKELLADVARMVEAQKRSMTTENATH